MSEVTLYTLTNCQASG